MSDPTPNRGSTMSDATPRPWTANIVKWRTRSCGVVTGANDDEITTSPITPEDAALIVRAVNAHEKLVEALKVVHARRIAWPAEVEALVVEALRAAEGDA